VLRVVKFHSIRIKITRFVLILLKLTTLSTLTTLIRRGERSAVISYSAYGAQADDIGSRGYNTALRPAYRGTNHPTWWGGR
jgi:hypothetical protein